MGICLRMYHHQFSTCIWQCINNDTYDTLRLHTCDPNSVQWLAFYINHVTHL